MINRVVLVGRLTKDPELTITPNGIHIAKFTLAVGRTFANQQGERETDFIRCIVWRKQAENVANFLKKGSLCGVDGRIEVNSFDGQDGKRVYMTEVVADRVQFLEPRNAQQQTNYGDSGYSNQQRTNQMPNQPQYQQNQPNYSRNESDEIFGSSGQVDISDDDLPF